MAVLLFDHLPLVAQRVALARHLLVLLDYDGTLTPIVDLPWDARLAPATRGTLTALALRPNTTITVLSGRALEDVQPRVGVEGLIYGGNHGLEIKGPGFYFIRAAPEDLQGRLHLLAASLAERFRHVPGVLIEDKRLTVSVHYRLVPLPLRESFQAEALAAFSGLSHDFQLTFGKMVYEIRPRLCWHKGTAARWIQEHVGGEDVLPIYLGDDVTDEDAFRELGHGITVKVGGASGTAAGYHVSGPADVCRFLGWLAVQGASSS